MKSNLAEEEMGRLPRSVHKYLKRDMYRVNGYLKSLDACLIAHLCSWQSENKVFGSLVEIGVHHGRLFLLLAMSRREQEKSLAIDLFEDDALNPGRYSGRSRALPLHAKRLGVSLGDNEILQGDSLKLTPAEILQRVGHVRMFSVDGGHRYLHVENDLRLAADTIISEGVVIVDDFCNAEWPEVTFATYDFLRANSGLLAPAIITKHKLYLAKPAVAAAVGEQARRFAGQQSGVALGSVQILDSEIPYLRVGITEFLLDAARSRFSRVI